MQETRNNCFGSKKCSTTFRQVKTGKNDFRNVTATQTLLLHFGVHFGSRASYGVILQVIFNRPSMFIEFLNSLSFLNTFDSRKQLLIETIYYSRYFIIVNTKNIFSKVNFKIFTAVLLFKLYSELCVTITQKLSCRF